MAPLAASIQVEPLRRSNTLRKTVPFDLLVLVFFGAFGYCAKKLSFDVTPMVMAFLLGPTIEYSLGQTLILAQGNFLHYIFVERPITAGLLLMTPVVAYLMWRRVARLRRDSERVATD